MEPTKPHTHEGHDVDLKVILGWLGGLFGLLVGTLILMFVMYHFMYVRKDRLGQETVVRGYDPRANLPEPKLQVRPRDDLKALRAEEDALLDHYGWVDRKSGVVRIPIERAIELTAERGLPARREESPR